MNSDRRLHGERNATQGTHSSWKSVARLIVSRSVPLVHTQCAARDLIRQHHPFAACADERFAWLDRLERQHAPLRPVSLSRENLGLTIVDLSDAWTPTMCALSGELTPNIRASYLALASSDADDALAELYGAMAEWRLTLALHVAFSNAIVKNTRPTRPDGPVVMRCR